MKIPGFILFMLLCSQAFSQRVTGFVFDKATRSPIPNASVKKGLIVQRTAYDGYFSTTNLRFGDTIKVTSIGYATYNYVVGMRHPDTIRIYMEASSIMLNNVSVNAKRNAKLDSINTRNEFARIFAYKAPTIADAFLTVDPYEYHPSNYIIANNSTASLVGIDLLSIASLFGKNKSPDTKLHELALQDEEIKYVDHRFSKQKITSITNLKGKALDDFIQDYRPAVNVIKQMSDYDLIVYIKKSYAQFAKNGNKAENVLFN